MANRTIAAAGALVALAAFGLGYAIARRPAAKPERAADTPRGAEQARLAIAEIVNEPATLENGYRLASLLRALGPDAVPAIEPTLRDPTGNLNAAQALLLIQFWVEQDAEDAATWASYAPLGYRTLALHLAIERLAESDLPAARRLAGGSGNTHLVKSLVTGWMRSGEPGLEDWIRNLGLGFERQKALGAYAREMIRLRGTEATAAWADALPDAEDGFKKEAFWRVTTELTYADPAAGRAFYEKHRNGSYGDNLLVSVSNAWVAVDGPAAMQWLSEQPEGQQRDDAVLDAVRSWTMSNSDALVSWARGWGRDATPHWFQPALPIFAKVVAVEDPAEAVEWAARIEDEGTRHLTFIQIAHRWRQRDPAAADAWLAASPLSEKQRARARGTASGDAKTNKTNTTNEESE